MSRGALLALLVFIALCGAAILWWYLARDAAAPGGSSATVSEPGSEFRGVELLDVDPDGTRWRIQAEEGIAWETEGRGELKGVKATFEKDGRTVRAEAGSSRMETRDVIRFLEGVTIQWEGYELRLADAAYRRGEAEVVSDGAVVLTGPGLTVNGKGLEVDMEGKRARILSAVSAVVGGGKR